MTGPQDPLFDHVAGYADRMVVAPGEAVAWHFSAHPPEPATLNLRRMVCANREPGGPPERYEPVGWAPASALALAPAETDRGSRIEVEVETRPLDTVTLAAAILPTRSSRRRTVLFASGDGSGLGLLLAPSGELTFCARVAGASVDLPLGLVAPTNAWSLLSLAVDLGGGALTLAMRSRAPHRPWDRGAAAPSPPSRRELRFTPLRGMSVARVLIGSGPPDSRNGFDGRIDLPVVLTGCLDLLETLGREDAEPALRAMPGLVTGFSFRPSAEPFQLDLLGRRAVAVNHPVAAVRGYRWSGEVFDLTSAPQHYSALHFNSDALTDAGWPASGGMTIPRDARSGVYVATADTASGRRGHATFIVSGAGRPTADVAVLLPTFSYLAYASAPDTMIGPTLSETHYPAEELASMSRGLWGRSLYDRHRDGSGVLVTSHRRPLLGFGPDYRPWGLVADSLLLDWLEKEGTPFDVVTDHDLHGMGAEALRPYRVVMTGHHPEYATTRMLDALDGWITAGGRLIYLGGNGFYWRTAIDTTGAIEVRRAEGGTRPHAAPPGESWHAFDGRYGGIWRRLGRPPQLLVGVGMTAQGFERGTYYEWQADADDPALSFVRAGVSGDTFGHRGLLGGGASGYEIDRYDPALGSPPGWVLATSRDHHPTMLRTVEELLSYVPPFDDPKSRSDVVLLGNDAGGAVFSVGSMTWVGSLHAPGGCPMVAQVTRNVIARFRDPAPLPKRL